MPTNPINPAPFDPFILDALDDIVNKPIPKKAVIKKPLVSTFPTEGETIPQDYSQLRALYVAVASREAFTRRELERTLDRCQKLENELMQTQDLLSRCPDIDQIHKEIMSYIKHNKLDFKVRKNRLIVNDFIAGLEFRSVPLDDELVD